MKTAKEIKIDNRTYTVLECTNCGATTRVVGKLGSKKARVAQERACATCTPRHFHRPSQGWWVAFGLDKNPYVYGPMRHKRTGIRFRMEEARRMGWTAWTWNDEYSEERKGVTIT